MERAARFGVRVRDRCRSAATSGTSAGARIDRRCSTSTAASRASVADATARRCAARGSAARWSGSTCSPAGRASRAAASTLSSTADQIELQKAVLQVIGDFEVEGHQLFAGAELDLLIERRGRRYGFELKHIDSISVTKSMHIVMADLGLDALWVVHPGERSYSIGKGMEALAIRERLGAR